MDPYASLEHKLASLFALHCYRPRPDTYLTRGCYYTYMCGSLGHGVHEWVPLAPKKAFRNTAWTHRHHRTSSFLHHPPCNAIAYRQTILSTEIAITRMCATVWAILAMNGCIWLNKSFRYMLHGTIDNTGAQASFSFRPAMLSPMAIHIPHPRP